MTTEKYYCPICLKKYNSASEMKCTCGEPLQLDFHPEIDVGKFQSRERTMWRYREAIPVSDDSLIVSFSEGFTPMIRINISGADVLVKQDQLFPSGSYKDRGASVLVSRMNELGIREAVEDSSGNAGAAIAAYCAKAGIMCRIYVPDSTSPGKLSQITSYGAELVKVKGSRDDTADATLKAAVNSYYASHVWNPYFFHGTKTFAYEVCEQLGWKAPDAVVLPAGNGTILIGSYIGFRELHENGIIGSVPRIIGVQAENCAPVYHGSIVNGHMSKKVNECISESADRSNCGTVNSLTSEPLPPFRILPTIAEGIAIGRPARKNEMIRIIEETDGCFVTVSEEDIMRSHKDMCRKGFYIEPTSAAVIAGCGRYAERSGRRGHEIIVSLFTGHGLKSAGK